ncbi:hypothetical protein M430DRAFT_53016 [Amorphotheca resinae ATCC 22711]|uniref:PCI domain-containing protein n=1 Tax=Amorphotheca resinae ATCC 22711 TaxID=857342 RepID=A0A2T3AVS6_AMORE|nr:hypothetical protein M430DRAFT_53016 [Amorphotheca resinae ATCC 22711]PSS12733.1 hypothetical protein M430DRAFT_53016 [Amorphotheca resinae ATCC 22711]
MEQTKALNALEPFLALTKSASSPRAAADLITRATSHPNTFIFAELLQAPQIQALAQAPEQASYLALLKLFSYGTYTDYINTPNLPPLNEQQTLKLRQLSFLTLARNPANLSYANLLRELGLETPRELEDLVISAIYAGLVSGTLDPYHQVVRLSSVSPLRDLPPNSISSMLSTLNEWSSRCVSTLAELEKQIATFRAEALKRHRDEQEWAATVEKLAEGKSSDKNQSQSSGSDTLYAQLNRKLGAGAASKRGNGGMDGQDNDDMDLDEEDEDTSNRRELRSAKKRGFSNLGSGK